jgi:phosphoserine aminotransferase
VFSVQKGFGLPAGLGVAILSERAIERAAARAAAGRDAGWLRRFAVTAARAEEGETVETPNVLALALLARACVRLAELGGQDELERTTAGKAEDLLAWAEAHGRLTPFVRRREHRARTVLCLELPEGTDAGALRARLAARGLIVGSGYGRHRGRQLRVANFPAHSAGDLRRLRCAIDEELAGCPRDDGAGEA